MYKPKKESFKHRCHVRIWSKWRHFLSLFWLTGILPHWKRSETTYLREKQCKKNLQVLVQEISYYKLEGFQPWFSKHLSFDNHVDECRSIKLLCTETFFSYLRKWSPRVNNMATPTMQRKAYNKAMNTNSRAELIKISFLVPKWFVVILSHQRQILKIYFIGLKSTVHGIYSATDVSVDREDTFWTVLIYHVEFMLTIFVPQKIH